MPSHATHYMPSAGRTVSVGYHNATGTDYAPFVVALTMLDDADPRTRTGFGARFSSTPLLAAHTGAVWADVYAPRF